MQVNQFNFALKWALIMAGIGILFNLPILLIGSARSLSISIIIDLLYILGLLSQIVVMTVAILKYARESEHNIRPGQVWSFAALAFLMNMVISIGVVSISSLLLSGGDGQEGGESFYQLLIMAVALTSDSLLPLIILFAILFIIGFYLALPITIAGQWRTFEKGGKPGWACLVPIYNLVCMIEIGKSPTWWIILMFVPFVNIVFAVLLLNAFVKSFGKDGGWTIGLIFLPFIFYPKLAWGDAHYQYGDFESGDLNVEDHLVE